MKKSFPKKILKSLRKKSALAIWYIVYFLIISLGIYIIIHKPSIPIKTFINQPSNQNNGISKKIANLSGLKYLITTVAGTGEAGYSGDNGIATDAKINIPYGIAVSKNGTLYIADRYNNRIRKVDPSGIISTFAGIGLSQSICTIEPRAEAHIPSPEKIALGADGSLYISSSSDHRIRKIDMLGIVKVVAGTGDAGYNIDGIIATSSQLNSPNSIVVNPLGNLYIADTSNHRIRRVDPKGIITTIAGIGTPGFSGDNGIATKAQIDSPSSVAVASDGSVYFTHGLNPRIRKISPQGKITTIAGTGIAGFSNDGTHSTKANLSEWSSIIVAPDDTLYIVDHKNHRILLIDSKGFIRVIAGTGTPGFSGDGGMATQATLGHPTSIDVTENNTIYISDADNNRIRKLILATSPSSR